METGLFEGSGLTKGEAAVYAALIGLGETTTGAIIQKTRMQKSAVYFCLERLLSQGLASYIMKNNKKYFQASPPDRLVDILGEKEEGLRKQKEKVKQALPGMVALAGAPAKEDGARFFAGWNGMKSAFDDILRTLKKGDEYYVFGVYTSPKIAERFRRFIAGFQKKRAGKGIRLRIMVNEDRKATIGADRKKERFTEVRFIPKEYATPAVINIYGNKTLIALWTENPAAFVVESKEAANSFRNYFRLIWEIAKEK